MQENSDEAEIEMISGYNAIRRGSWGEQKTELCWWNKMLCLDEIVDSGGEGERGGREAAGCRS